MAYDRKLATGVSIADMAPDKLGGIVSHQLPDHD
jgi:hypothetical protein